MSELLDKLKGLQKKRQTPPPFASSEELLEWSDQVTGLLSAYSEAYANQFKSCIRSAGRYPDEGNRFRRINDAIGLLTTVIVEIESKPNDQEHSSLPSLVVDESKSVKGFKQRVEEHPVWFVSIVAIGAFFSGFNAYPMFHDSPKPTVAKVDTQKSIECHIDGLVELNKAHDDRLSKLQDALLQAERKANDITDVNSVNYSVTGIRELKKILTEENDSYTKRLQALNGKCNAVQQSYKIKPKS